MLNDPDAIPPKISMIIVASGSSPSSVYVNLNFIKSVAICI